MLIRKSSNLVEVMRYAGQLPEKRAMPGQDVLMALVTVGQVIGLFDRLDAIFVRLDKNKDGKREKLLPVYPKRGIATDSSPPPKRASCFPGTLPALKLVREAKHDETRNAQEGKHAAEAPWQAAWRT